MRPSILIPVLFGLAASLEASQPVARSQGAVVGEIRPFAFGSDEAVVAVGTGSELLTGTLRDFGWISCEGQSLKDSDFPELAALLKKAPLTLDAPPRPEDLHGSIWGAIDLKHTFSIPDLRGLFLRGYDPSAPALPNPAGEPGDGRGAPRPDLVPGGGDPGTPVGTEVGSFQGDAVGQHHHGLPTNGGGKACCSVQTVGTVPVLNGSLPTDEGRGASGNAPLGAETRPKNVHVMYCLWTGRKVTGAAIGEAPVRGAATP